MFRSNSKFVLINKTYRPREWSILHWLYVDAVKAESVNILKTLDMYSISTISRDETLISRNKTFAPQPRGDYSGGLMVDPGEGPGGLDPPSPTPPSGIIRNYNVQPGWRDGVCRVWGRSSLTQKSSTALSESEFGPPPPAPH